VNVGESYCILTAAHVWEKKLKSALKLGITLTDNINHNRSIDICTIVPTLAKPGDDWNEWGPDLALLRIPREFVGGIKAYQVFEDPTGAGRLLNAASLEVWAIMGAPEELGTFTQNHASVQISGSFVVPQYRRRGEHDYYDFKMDTSAENVPKTSFGGFSGGGLWRILIYRSPETGKIDWLQRLKGVAFYEFQPQDPRIRCHGPKSITALIGAPVELDVNTLADAYLDNIRREEEDAWACDEVRHFILYLNF
jgi:hypothetical protein